MTNLQTACCSFLLTCSTYMAMEEEDRLLQEQLEVHIMSKIIFQIACRRSLLSSTLAMEAEQVVLLLDYA